MEEIGLEIGSRRRKDVVILDVKEEVIHLFLK